MKRIVITGATSMIGLNFIQYILKQDIEVLAIIRENSRKKYLLPDSNNIKVIECDLQNLASLEIKERNYDTFIHLAWDSSFGDGRDDVFTQNHNITYTLEAVNLAKKLGCKRFIGAGSQAEYGRVSGIITPDTSANPESGYGIAKLCAGKLSRILASQVGIEHIWTRIFSVYGPYDNNNTMVMSSISKMIDENKSPDYTKAEQLWDYLYAEDMARALYLIAEKGKNNSIYCIAKGEVKPLYKYIEQIRDSINKEIKLNIGVVPYSNKQVMNLQTDISNLKNDTGFKAEVNFEEGIRRTIEWYKREKLKK